MVTSRHLSDDATLAPAMPAPRMARNTALLSAALFDLGLGWNLSFVAPTAELADWIPHAGAASPSRTDASHLDLRSSA